MLSVKKRQEYLKALGFYEGKIDGKEGTLTKQAYKDLQNKYYKRKKDKDGIYGKNTEILLLNAYNVYKYCKNFELNDFSCHCNGVYCNGYPAKLSVNLLKNIQNIRNKFGATTITSGLRCKTWNSKQSGSASKSKHMDGKALDWSNAGTKTLSGRKEQITYWFKLLTPHYSYCNGFWKNKKSSGKMTATYMGNSIHGDIK